MFKIVAKKEEGTTAEFETLMGNLIGMEDWTVKADGYPSKHPTWASSGYVYKYGAILDHDSEYVHCGRPVFKFQLHYFFNRKTDAEFKKDAERIRDTPTLARNYWDRGNLAAQWCYMTNKPCVKIEVRGLESFLATLQSVIVQHLAILASKWDAGMTVFRVQKILLQLLSATRICIQTSNAEVVNRLICQLNRWSGGQVKQRL